MRVYKALTIAGSDSGGGAGIQADLKTFQELHVYGMSALTAVTAQNTLGVQSVYPLSAEAVERQLAAIAADLPPDALKTGMLFSADIIEAAAQAIQAYGWKQLVVDPVMIAKGGAPLLQPEAVEALRARLLPLARVVTPNIPEAEALTGLKLAHLHDRKKSARLIHSCGAEFVLIKGGHDESSGGAAVDLLYDGSVFLEFAAPRIATVHTHGTGCTFAAALAAGLAKGLTVQEAVRLAKSFIQAAIAKPLGLGGGHGPTNHWAYQRLLREEQAAPEDAIQVRGALL